MHWTIVVRDSNMPKGAVVKFSMKLLAKWWVYKLRRGVSFGNIVVQMFCLEKFQKSRIGSIVCIIQSSHGITILVHMCRTSHLCYD